MFPANQQIFAAESERDLYEKLRTELPDDVRVYYSVAWNSDSTDDHYMGEGDFIILDPNFGFIVLEVKGGYKIDHSFGQWTLWETASKSRKLNKSPYEQARTSMHTFVQKYREKYYEQFPATYAFAVCFPHYDVDNDLCLEMNATNTICQSMIERDGLWTCIRRIFFAHRHGGACTEAIVKKLDTLFQGEAFTKISAGNVINSSRRKFSEIGMIQNACIDLLWNHKQAMIIGSAGTGKTSIAIQKACICAESGMKVLYLCFNRLIAKEVQRIVEPHGVRCSTFHKLVLSIVGESVYERLSTGIDLSGVLEEVSQRNADKFDAIIVDEAQDFHEEWALTIRSLLKDDHESILYVFYDEEQNIFQRNFGEAFLIQSEPYLLRRNLRNTKNIWDFVVDDTEFGGCSYSNGIAGLDPKIFTTRNHMKFIESITRLVRTITNEGVSSRSITILSDRKLENTPLQNLREIAGYKIQDINDAIHGEENEVIRFSTVQAFKGLDSEVVISLLSANCSKQLRYVAYSRARCLLYLYEFNADRYQG